MDKILFVDEKYYRFAFYYNEEPWWLQRGVKAIFKSYETKKDKWLIYLWLIVNRPKYVVFVQLSIKNIILAKLCNILKVKTLFWQHGVFAYDEAIINKYRKIGAKLNSLLCFSEYDYGYIRRYFRNVDKAKIIPHYEIQKISKGIDARDSFLFIGQILTKEQLLGSSSKFVYDSESEKLLNGLWEYLNKNSIKTYIKKHPGDRSNYIKNLEKKYANLEIEDRPILPKAIIGHFSTLILPYLSLGIPFIQLKHIINDQVNFTVFGSDKIYKVDTIAELDAIFKKVQLLEYKISNTDNFSISAELIRNFELK